MWPDKQHVKATTRTGKAIVQWKFHPDRNLPTVSLLCFFQCQFCYHPIQPIAIFHCLKFGRCSAFKTKNVAAAAAARVYIYVELARELGKLSDGLFCGYSSWNILINDIESDNSELQFLSKHSTARTQIVNMYFLLTKGKWIWIVVISNVTKFLTVETKYFCWHWKTNPNRSCFLLTCTSKVDNRLKPLWRLVYTLFIHCALLRNCPFASELTFNLLLFL